MCRRVSVWQFTNWLNYDIHELYNMASTVWYIIYYYAVTLMVVLVSPDMKACLLGWSCEKFETGLFLDPRSCDVLEHDCLIPCKSKHDS